MNEIRNIYVRDHFIKGNMQHALMVLDNLAYQLETTYFNRGKCAGKRNAITSGKLDSQIATLKTTSNMLKKSLNL